MNIIKVCPDVVDGQRLQFILTFIHVQYLRIQRREKHPNRMTSLRLLIRDLRHDAFM